MAGYDFTNRIIGDFKVLRVAELDSSKHKIWLCECTKCGETQKIRSTELNNNTRKTCKYCRTANIKKNNTKKKDDIVVSDKTIDIDKYENITLIDGNILNVPIYFKVAQSINADLTFSPKGLTGLMDKYFNIGEQLLDFIHVEWEAGDVIPVGSVYNLLTKQNKDDVANYDTLRICLENLRDLCYRENTQHLAIPKIGCGRDKLDFNKVYSLICEIFGDTTINVCVFGDYSNDPEYDVEYIEFLLK